MLTNLGSSFVFTPIERVLVDISIKHLIKSSTWFDCSFMCLAIRWLRWVYVHIRRPIFGLWPPRIIPFGDNPRPRSVETPWSPHNHCPKKSLSRPTITKPMLNSIEIMSLNSFHPLDQERWRKKNTKNKKEKKKKKVIENLKRKYYKKENQHKH